MNLKWIDCRGCTFFPLHIKQHARDPRASTPQTSRSKQSCITGLQRTAFPGPRAWNWVELVWGCLAVAVAVAGPLSSATRSKPPPGIWCFRRGRPGLDRAAALCGRRGGGPVSPAVGSAPGRGSEPPPWGQSASGAPALARAPPRRAAEPRRLGPRPPARRGRAAGDPGVGGEVGILGGRLHFLLPAAPLAGTPSSLAPPPEEGGCWACTCRTGSP